MAAIMNAGDRIRIKREQHNFGKPRFPGRIGVLIRSNKIDENCWYIQLDATPRAKARLEHFHESDLELEDEAPNA